MREIPIKNAVTVGGIDLSSKNFSGGYLISVIGVPRSGPGVVHWTIAGGRPGLAEKLIRLQPGNRRQPTISLDGIAVHVWLVPQGMSIYSDHVVLVWRWRGEEYQVTVHRSRGLNAATDQAVGVASSIIKVLKRPKP